MQAVKKLDVAGVVKWAASAAQIMGCGATAFGLSHCNIRFFLIGLTGWFAVGVMWNDRAIMLIHAVALAAIMAGMAST